MSHRSQPSNSLQSLTTIETVDDYNRLREFTAPSLTPVPEYRVLQGTDGCWYAVFKDANEAYEFDVMSPHYFDTCFLSCFGQQDNAYFLGVLH